MFITRSTTLSRNPNALLREQRVLARRTFRGTASRADVSRFALITQRLDELLSRGAPLPGVWDLCSAPLARRRGWWPALAHCAAVRLLRWLLNHQD